MASGFGSASRRHLLAAGALALLAAACGRLEVEPGGDFAVRVLDAQPIQAVGKITVPVRVAVDGCETFRAAVGTGGVSHPVDVRRDGDTFVLDVPVEWVRSEEGTCLPGADQAIPSAARVDVTCADAGRTASAALEVSYATADRVLRAMTAQTGDEVRLLYRSNDPVAPAALLPAPGTEEWAYFSKYVDWGSSFEVLPIGWGNEHDPLVQPHVVASDQARMLTGACGVSQTCTPIEVAPGVLAPSQSLWVESLVSFDGWNVAVPAHVTDLAQLPDGEILVVSRFSTVEVTYGVYVSPHDTVVARVALTPWPSDGSVPQPFGTVQIVGYFPDEVVRTPLSRAPDGRLAFVTQQHPGALLSKSTVLNVTDGYTLERTPDLTAKLEGGWRFASPSLSPDASTILVGSWLGPTGADTWTQLPVQGNYTPYSTSSGVSWGEDALVLWEGEAIGTTPYDGDVGHAEVFDLAPPYARLFRHDVAPLPGSSAPAALHGAVAVDDHVVLTTNTGVRILDRAGKVVGGADPLPCRMSPTAVAIASGPHHAAVGAGEQVLVFDLSKL